MATFNRARRNDWRRCGDAFNAGLYVDGDSYEPRGRNTNAFAVVDSEIHEFLLGRNSKLPSEIEKASLKKPHNAPMGDDDESSG